VQLAAGGHTQADTQTQRPRALHPARLQLGTPTRLLGLRLLHARVVAQRTVGNLAVRTDVLRGRPQVGPVGALVHRHALDQLAITKGILIGGNDRRRRLVRQPAQRLATEDVHPGKGVTPAHRAATELDDTTAGLDLDRARPLPGNQQHRRHGLPGKVLLDQPPQVVVQNDVDIVHQDVLGVGQQPHPVTQTAARLQKGVLGRQPQVPAMLATQARRGFVHALALVRDVHRHRLQAQSAELTRRQLQKRHAAERHQGLRTRQRRRTQPPPLARRQDETADVVHPR